MDQQTEQRLAQVNEALPAGFRLKNYNRPVFELIQGEGNEEYLVGKVFDLDGFMELIGKAVRATR